MVSNQNIICLLGVIFYLLNDLWVIKYRFIVNVIIIRIHKHEHRRSRT